MSAFAWPVLLSLLANIGCVLPSNDPRYYATKKYRLCGSQIDKAISKVCLDYASPHPEDYFPIQPEKRSTDLINYETGDSTRLPYFKKHTALSMLSHTPFSRMRRGGIVDECCHSEGCSYREVAAYCAAVKTNALVLFTLWARNL